MKTLKQELLDIAEKWNASGKFDDTEFKGRYFINDYDLDEFSIEHGLNQILGNNQFDQEKIEKACDCKVLYDYVARNPNRQFGDNEIIFNKENDV